MPFRTYLSRINGKAALAGMAILFVIDLYLFKSGLSWTPLHYESLAPMLVMAPNQGWTQRYAVIASTLLFGSVVILYFAFGLSYQLASESWTFIAIASAAILIYIFQLWKVIATNRHIPFLFLITALSLLTADKLFSRDMLSSAYLPHFFKVGTEANSTISHNPV